MAFEVAAPKGSRKGPETLRCIQTHFEQFAGEQRHPTAQGFWTEL